MSESKYRAVLGVTGVALFMIVLDNLIVMSSLPAIQRDLGATLEQLEWIVDAYILSFAVLMLAGAALGERFGRRRMLIVGLLLFFIGVPVALLAIAASASSSAATPQDAVLALDLRGIGCSAGSACQSGSITPSHVLTAIGVEPDLANAAIRMSIGCLTTDACVDRVADVFPALVAKARGQNAATAAD